MSSAIRPESMGTSERLGEIDEILVAGLTRLRARKSSPLSRNFGESSLDCPGHQSSHADRNSLEGDS